MKANKDNNFTFQQVYKLVQQVPLGRVTTYGAIAEYLGTRGGARMVGWAMNASITAREPIPAHRVVNRKGLLTGKHHFGGPLIMQQLLEQEGLKIENDQIINFSKVFWDPNIELKVKQK